MSGGVFRIVTTAGLLGLVVLHADSFGRLVARASEAFREAVRLA